MVEGVAIRLMAKLCLNIPINSNQANTEEMKTIRK